MLANLYGVAMPARLDIESQILSRCVIVSRSPLSSIVSARVKSRGHEEQPPPPDLITHFFFFFSKEFPFLPSSVQRPL